MASSELSASPGRPTVWQTWWGLARPFSLTASIVPVLVGTSIAFASSAFRALDLFGAMLLSAVLIQVGTNMFNEYYDYKHGLDTPETVGIAGAIVRGLVPALDVFKGAIASFSVALVLGLYIVARTSPEVLVGGVASALAGYVYTGGPLPIAYTPLGELEVFVFMGPVIVGLAYYLQTGSVSASALWASLPVACLVASILLANNVRDVAADGRVGRHTLPVTLGRSAGVVVFAALLAGAYVGTGIAAGLSLLPATTLLPFLTLPTPVRLVRLYLSTEEPRRLNAGVRGAAGLHARFGLLLAIGIAAGPLIGWQPPAL